MNSYDLGDVARISTIYTITATGAVLDPTTVTMVVMAPDRTETTYTYAGGTVTKDSTGNYHVDVSIAAAGLWRYRWTSTGTGQASEEGAFEVRPRRVT
jgi:hypothetical protein